MESDLGTNRIKGSPLSSEASAPRSDRFLELRPFYHLCWVNWGLTAAISVMLTGNGYASRNTLVPSDAKLREVPMGLIAAIGMAMGLIAGIVLYMNMRARRRDASIEHVSLKQTTGRLRRRLDEWKSKLTQLVPPEARAEIAIAPGASNVMWTQRSNEARGEGPLILLTSAFWSEDQPEPELTAAFAHEAGHVAAGDVITFKRLWWSSVALWIGAPLLLAIVVIRLVVAGGGDRWMSFVNFFVAALIGLLATLASWSALLCAREIQADAFATDVMRDAGPIRAFLVRRAIARASETVRWRERVWRWIVQPDLKWRATLPALQGTIGGRISACLGFSMGAAVINGAWASALLSIFPYCATPSLLLLTLVIGYVAWLAFQFSWWRAQAAARFKTSWLSTVQSWITFTFPATALVLTALLVMQSGRNGNLAGSSGVGVDPWRTLLVVTGVQACTLCIVAFGATAHAADCLGRRVYPTIRGSTIAGVALLVVTLVAWLTATIAERVTGLNMLYLFAWIAPAMAGLLALRAHQYAKKGRFGNV